LTLREKVKSALLEWGGALCIFLGLAFLLMLIIQILVQGLGSLDIQFLTSYPSRFPERSGVLSALTGTLWLMGLTALISIPLGIMTAVFMEEYLPTGFWTRVLRLNIFNLAGVPSILFGVLGLAIFVRWFGMGRSLLAGALTISLMILPTIIVATGEALRSVPAAIRQAAFGVGATRRQVVWGQVLPVAMPGIITGVILALSRAIGEAAPLIMVGALTFVAFVPTNVFDSFTTLSIQIFSWASRPQVEFQEVAAAGIILLLLITLGMNALAIYLRIRSSKIGSSL
jgi:phosphate transport system permease protein